MSLAHTEAPAPFALLPVEEAACTLCGSMALQLLYRERYELAGRSALLTIGRCLGCDLVRVSPRLTREAVADVYRLDAINTISHGYCWEETADTSRFRPLLRRIAHLADRGVLLDVGCGAGDLLAEARTVGHWNLIGVDPSMEAVQRAETRVGCRIIRAALEELDLPAGSIDVVTMLGVLEHLHDPAATLRAAHRLMRPGGVLGIYVPNFSYLRLKDAGLLCLLRRGRRSELHPQEHLYGYTRRTLAALLEACGFEIVSLDVGQPFLRGGRLARLSKRAMYAAAVGLAAGTGIHLGGLEAVAVRRDAAGNRYERRN